MPLFFRKMRLLADQTGLQHEPVKADESRRIVLVNRAVLQHLREDLADFILQDLLRLVAAGNNAVISLIQGSCFTRLSRWALVRLSSSRPQRISLMSPSSF